jgi:O-antigen ligase
MKSLSIAGSLLLLLVSLIVSIWGAYEPALSLPALLTLLISLGLFVAIIRVPISPGWIARGLVVIGGLMAFYFVGQYGYMDYWTETGRLAQLGRVTGSLLPNLAFFSPNPNAVATFLEGVFLLSLVITWQSRGPKRIDWGIVAAIIGYGLLISGSRGAWFGLVIALGIWATLLTSNRALRFTLIGFMVIGSGLGIYIFSSLAPPEQHIPILSSLMETFQSRFTLYRNSFYLLGDYPFTGIGPGETFPMVYSRYQLLIQVPFLYYTHNLFLAIGLGHGILGLIALTGLIVQFYYFVIRVERIGLQEPAQSLFRAGWLGVTATFIHGLFDAVQFSVDRWTMLMLFSLLGLTVAVGRPVLMQSEVRITGDGGRVKLADYRKPLGLALLGIGIGVVVFWQSLLSAWYANLGAVYQTQAELSMELEANERKVVLARAIDYFERALRINPAQSSANRRLGMVALDYEHFDVAVTYLEQAYRQEPGNQATLKALGLAYLWQGQLDLAQERLRQLDDQDELIEELSNWSWWWGSQDRTDLSNYATEMIHLLRVG